MIGLKWIGQLSIKTSLFHNDVEMHLQGWDPKENPLPLCQLVYKAGIQK